MPLDKIKNLENQLSHILESDLCLLSIKDGCVELIFNTLRSLSLIFKSPLSPPQKVGFHENGVLRLYSEEKEYYRYESDQEVSTLKHQLEAIIGISHTVAGNLGLHHWYRCL